VRVRTDDEVYRVDAVWLGPPKATFPWRARYVAWGVGMLVFVLVLTGERAVGFGFGFFTVAWAVIATVVLTRLICSRISHERPLSAVFTMWTRELSTPRERATGNGGAVSATKVHVRSDRPRPKSKSGDQRQTPVPPQQRGQRHAQRSRAQAQAQSRTQAQPRARATRGMQQGTRGGQPGLRQPTRSAQPSQYVQQPQDWAGQPTGTGRGGAVRPRSKEVGGVRTQGRT
jgi:hypothetical protein